MAKNDTYDNALADFRAATRLLGSALDRLATEELDSAMDLLTRAEARLDRLPRPARPPRVTRADLLTWPSTEEVFGPRADGGQSQ